ncbi:MAG: hypothetical protein ACOC4G_06085 [Bacillota bacterium]
MFKIDPEFNNYFMPALKKWNKKYDSEEKMIKKPFSSPGYHTTLSGGYVHPTRESLKYAVALLDSGKEDWKQRSVKIIKKVISLQDTNPEHDTYGIWSWFYEEPLEQMSPPDWNWADFCGKQLLQVVLDHSERLSESLTKDIEESLFHACRSIINRDVSVSYTNIAIMGTYVTLVTGELYNQEEFLNYGKQNLEKFYNHTLYHGAFNEYNSPTYTIVAVEDLKRMLNHFQDNESRKKVKTLYNLGWKVIAHHFHPPTNQWSGPHSRCYSNFRDNKFWSRLQLATGLKFLEKENIEIGIDWPRIDLKCPQEYLEYFKKLEQSREEKEVYFKREEGNDKVAITYLTPQYSIGTFDHSILWNQRRALIGYFTNGNQPTYIHLRCLHDGYDFSSAVFHSLHAENKILSAVNFAVDGGDTHPSLDMMKNGTIKAEDLRLRLEFGGNLDNLHLPEQVNFNKKGFNKIKIGNTVMALSIPYVSFGEYSVNFITGKNEEISWLDIVFYQGQKKNIDFNKISEAVCTLAMVFIDNNKSISDVFEVEINKIDKNILLKWPEEDKFKLKINRNPDELSTLLKT